MDTKLTESAPAGLPSTCLPGLLRQQGYATAFLQSAVGEFERRPDLVRNLGYDEFFPVETFPTAGFGRANYFGWEDDIMLEPSRDWLRAQGDAPFLLTYLTVTGHHDYRLPGTFALENLADEEDLNNYLNGVRYVDRFVSKVFAMLAEEGRADDTLVVVTADHGEGFGEHGLRQHDNTIYNEGIKVPYLVYDPTDRRGRTVQRPVTTMSVPETVAERLGYRLSGGLAREESLFGGGGGGGGGGGRDGPSVVPVHQSVSGADRGHHQVHPPLRQPTRRGLRPQQRPRREAQPDRRCRPRTAQSTEVGPAAVAQSNPV